MLILRRKVNESIQIGDDIEITILAIEGEQIKIGIDAPKTVDIHRKEVYMAIKQENSEAANIPADLVKLFMEEKDQN